MNEKVESFKNRLKYALDSRGLRAVDLCRRTKISQSTMSQYLSGYAEPKKARLQLIADSLNIDPTWLMGLDVPMERTTIANLDEYKNKMKDFSHSWNIQYFERKMLESFSALSDNNKKRAISYTENLLNIQQMEEEQEHLIPIAAHERTDIEVTDEMRKHDDDLMNNDELWK